MSRPWGRWRARDVRRSGERPASCLRSGQLRACAAASFVPAQRPASCLRAAYTHEQHQVRQKHRRDGGSTNSDGRECLDSPLHTACDIERNSTFSFSSLHMAQPRNCYAWTEPRGTASKLLRLDRATWHSERHRGETARFSAGSPPAVCAQTNRTNMWVPSQESSHRREALFTTNEKHQRYN